MGGHTVTHYCLVSTRLCKCFAKAVNILYPHRLYVAHICVQPHRIRHPINVITSQ